MPEILAVDPGPVQSAFVVLDTDTQTIPRKDILPNKEMLEAISLQVTLDIDILAIEMVESFGMPVGREVFETVRWIGRFEERFLDRGHNDPEVHLIPRRDVKIHLCNSARAKDPNIRQALIDRFGPVGTKANPGRLYGFARDLWSALAVALTCADRMEAER